MKQRLFQILNIKVSESRRVFDLLAVQFFIGLGNALINIAAFTLFIYHFRITDLPLAYMVMAVMLIFLNIAYEKIEHRFSPLQLLKFIIGLSAIALVPIWFGLAYGNHSLFIFILLVWTILSYMATGYAFWGLVCLMFNIRESKRVFSVAGAGDIPAKLIGYLIAPLLIPFLGIENLIWVSVLSLATGFLLLRRILKKRNWQPIKTQHHVSRHQEDVRRQKRDPIGSFFKEKLIFYISILSLLSYNVFNLVDYTFLAQVKLKYEDIASLATFIATFFALGRLIAMVLKLALTSRVIEKWGIVRCLFITPITLLIFCVLFFLYGDREGYGVYIFGMMALLTEVLRSAIQEPVFFILFQPLKEPLRLKGHMISKGYMLSPSLLIVGLSFYLLNYFGHPVTIMLSIKILLLNLGIWALLIFFLGSSYVDAVHQSIKKGIFLIAEAFRMDGETHSILLKKVKEGRETERLYALDLLEKANYKHLHDLLKDMLMEESPNLRKYALSRMEAHGTVNTAQLRELIGREQDQDIREKLIDLLCRHDPGFLQEAAQMLKEGNDGIRRTIIIAMLNQSEFNYLLLAGNSIKELLDSEKPADRMLALEIISDVRHVRFLSSLEKLIDDTDDQVKAQAILTCGKLRIRHMLPRMLQLLNSPETRYMVLKGLQLYGDDLFRDLRHLDKDLQSPCYADLVKVAGKARGNASSRFLVSLLGDPGVPGDKVLDALWGQGYEAADKNEKRFFEEWLQRYLQYGQNKMADFFALNTEDRLPLLSDAVRHEIRSDLISALKISSIVYHRAEINRVLEILDLESGDKHYNAMEMLEFVLPKSIAREINELFEFILDPVHQPQRFARQTDQTAVSDRLFGRHDVPYNAWTKAVYLYASWQSHDSRLADLVSRMDGNGEHTIIRETREFILADLKLRTNAADRTNITA